MLRISALYNTYSSNAEIYIQKTDGQITAVFGGYQSGFSLAATNNADFCELDSFFKLLGAEVFCSLSVADQLDYRQKTECNIMRFAANAEGSVKHSKISEIYPLLQNGADGDIELPSFDLWYTDFCLRFNHKSAEYALHDNAVALCGFMTEDASLITGVAVKKEQRGKGYGKRVVEDLVTIVKKTYKNSKIYAAVSDEKIGFYEKCGFIFDSKCAVLKY